ncbi:MAG: hypothetical protein ACI4Q4_09850 [Oscillospiraceae bacterium]
MEELISKVRAKLDETKATGRAESVMAEYVKNTLIDFSGQSEEFARAVIDGGTFEKCMKEVAKGSGVYLSDLEAYARAVKYYFPTATIECTMRINAEGNITGAEASEEKDPEKASAINLSLDDLLGV